MAKRQTGRRLTGPTRNLVDTPPEAVEPLLTHLPPGLRFIEPCAGAGKLRDALVSGRGGGGGGLVCVDAFDVQPRGPGVRTGDARTCNPTHVCISNPPYDRALAVPILDAACTWTVSSWWLTPLDWLANTWFAPFAPHVSRIIPVGRVSWVRTESGGPTGPGFDNSVWIELDWMPTGLILPRARRAASARTGAAGRGGPTAGAARSPA